MPQPAFADHDAGPVLLRRPDLWRGLLARGLTTMPEQPGPTRSDGHPWSAHPPCHFAASILGILPVPTGYAAVEGRPLDVPRQRLAVAIPHRRCRAALDLRRDDGGSGGTVAAPAGVLINSDHGFLPA